MTRNRGRKSPLFTHTLWSKWSDVSNGNPTTNNSNEAFNKQFSLSTETNPSLWTVLSAFNREDSLARKTLVDAARSANNTTRAVNIRQKDARQSIKSMTEMYHGMSRNEYVKSIAGILSK